MQILVFPREKLFDGLSLFIAIRFLAGIRKAYGGEEIATGRLLVGKMGDREFCPGFDSLAGAKCLFGLRELTNGRQC